MRIHTNVELNTIELARIDAGVSFTRISVHNSKSAKYGYEIVLSGNSNHRQNQGSDYAATWDQWGVFLSVIFNADPNTKCWAYSDADDFDFKTNHRFDPEWYNRSAHCDYWPNDSHGDHKWIVGVPFQNNCSKCSAVRRWN